MAQGNNEHRMVFDIRGRRRHVVKFVYAILAILMAGSLFLVTGAINIELDLRHQLERRKRRPGARKAGRTRSKRRSRKNRQDEECCSAT